jgi:diaminohydroxyphosphoribosylaminopyrimidine deaminase/5-amino-6-(5-phosphoribosylamino)uracil reductase
MDPTSRGEGGAALLRKAGVEVEQDFLKDEALLVLGPWLASLKSDRPFITWVYEAGPDGAPIPHDAHGAVSDGVRALRESHDLVIRQGGKIEEGTPESHGDGVFHVPYGPMGNDAAEIVSALTKAGARSVLLDGVSDELTSLIAAGMVDQIISYLPNTPRSWSPQANCGSLTAIPDGYRLTGVTRQGNYVRLIGRRA